MRIDLDRVRTASGSTTLVLSALVAGIVISAWLVMSTRLQVQRAEILETEVGSIQARVDAIPEVEGEPQTPEEIEEQIRHITLPSGDEETLRLQLGAAASRHNIALRRLDYMTTSLDPNDAAANPVLISLGITQYTLITMEYAADYRDSAQFIDTLSSLPQQVSILKAELHGRPQGVEGTLTLRVYRRG